MSNASTMKTQIDAKLVATLSGYTKIPDPYDPEENNILYLKKGYGIAYGPGQNLSRYATCRRTYQTEISILLVNQITTTDHNTAAREAIENSLMNDADALKYAIELDPDLNGNSAKTVYLDDSGIEYIKSDRARFYAVQINFTCEYHKNLS